VGWVGGHHRRRDLVVERAGARRELWRRDCCVQRDEGRDRDAPGTKPIGWFGQRGIGDRKNAGVVLLDGVGVAGATVRLAGPLTMAGLAPELKVVTDAAGGSTSECISRRAMSSSRKPRI
jgi:hypothetical protein